tara:strand:- start:135 stop:593 length:459 start_codon:yes stop_codon:yes gene_type:complete
LFRGISNASIDKKGRLGLPQRFREIYRSNSAGNLVVTIDTQDRCLLIYPLNEWDVVQRRLESLSNVHQGTRMLQRRLIGHATDLEMDKSGRILLPSLLRNYAYLKNKTVLIGQGNKLEAWSDEVWEDQMEAWQDQGNKAAMENVEMIGKVSI